ncbi:S9 family peptidase [Kordiimonas aquimaris]|uniref:S9 family peptidase n=1 Tax=Kordiimonas aquimaris TaxID=707591 RepID=UPI0021D2CE49|nr:S9 family peptidase [Kordiimonas aquimaris]
MRSVLLSLIVAVFTLSITARADQSGQSDTLDTLLGLTIVRDAYIAPDGKHVAFITFENDFKNNKDMSQLWVVGTDGGEPVQLTHGEESVGEIEWSADSQWIAFMRKGKLGFMRASGGEAKMAALDIKGISSLRFAPNGRTLYFTAGPDNKDLMKARKERYGDYNVVREDGGYQHIWRVGITADMGIDGEPEQLTDGRDFSVTGYAISPNGKQLAFATWPSPHLADLLKGRMYVMDTTGGEPILIDDAYGVKSRPVWHQGGNKLAYTNATGFPTLSDIVIRDANGRNAKTIEMQTYDPFIVRFDGDTIMFSASERTDLALFQINTKSENVNRVSSPDNFSYGFSISYDGNATAFLNAASNGITEVTTAQGLTITKLTNFSAQTVELEKPTRELITWVSDEGLEIEAVLTKPVGYETGKRYPLYVRTHGGPTGTDRPWMGSAARSIYHPDVLAAENGGALVLQTNYRGSAGYGEAFQSSNLKNLGIGPARDIIAGVKMLTENGMVDPDRVACLGWSQGGHISAMLATYSDICTAAIMGAGISDWRTYYYNTDITQFTTEYFGATPLADDAVYAKTSPVTYIENAQTPVLIQHGENDQRVPIANGYQFRQLLLDKGVDARMVVYGGMQHGPSKPRTRRAITEHALAWLREQMFDKEKANFVTPVSKTETDEQ